MKPTSNISKNIKGNIFLVSTLVLVILMNLSFVSATIDQDIKCHSDSDCNEQCLSCYTDSFNSINTNWLQIYPDNPAFIEDGRLKCLGATGNWSLSTSGITSNENILYGDFDIQVDYDATQMPASDSSGSAAFWIGGSKYVYDIVSQRNNDGSYSTIAWSNQGGSTYFANGAPITSMSSGKWRIQRTGNTIKVYQWENNQWVNFGSITNCDTSDMKVKLYVDNNYNSAWPGANLLHPRVPVAYFDNFIIKSNTCEDSNYMCINPGTEQSFCTTGMCGDTRAFDSYTQSGIIFTPVSNTIDSTGTNTLVINAQNLDSYSKTITYQEYQCRCQSHLGNPLQPHTPTICGDYWPFMKFIGPGDLVLSNAACNIVYKNATLGPNEKKTIEASVTQYQNQVCGSFQLDLNLVKVNGVNLNQEAVIATSVLDACNDCSNIANITCFNDSDCDDDNPSTDDKCINPGTTDSSCEHHLIIRCSKDSDCGCDGFEGTPFCQSGNVFGNYITYICNNPGTCHSYCSNSTEVKLKTTCLANETCSNGACVPKEIHCSKNSDCGSNGFDDSDFFCKNGNVFGNYITYKCNNPGTCNSYCSSSSEDKLKTECSSDEICSEGSCEAKSHGGVQIVYQKDGPGYVFEDNTNLGNFAVSGANETIAIGAVKKKGFNFSLWWIILIIGILILLLIILIVLVIKSLK